MRTVRAWLTLALSAYILSCANAARYASADAARADLARISASAKSLISDIDRARAAGNEARDALLAHEKQGPEVRSLERELRQAKERRFNDNQYQNDLYSNEKKYKENYAKASKQLAEFVGDRSALDRAERAERNARSALSSAESYKKRAIKELEEGYYCSKCNRPASQIENEENLTFREHLRNVSGRSIPAGASLIQKKTAEFNKKVSAARQSLEKAQLDRQSKAQAYEQYRQTEISKKQSALKQLQTNYREKEAELQDKLQNAQAEFDRKKKSDIDSLEWKIKNKLRDYNDERERLRDSVARAKKAEGNLRHRIRMLDIEADAAQWEIRFYEGIARRKAARETQIAKQEAVRAIREAKRVAREAELARIKAQNKQAVSVRRIPYSSFQPAYTNSSSSSSSRSTKRELEEALAKAKKRERALVPQPVEPPPVATNPYSVEQQKNIAKAKADLEESIQHSLPFEELVPEPAIEPVFESDTSIDIEDTVIVREDYSETSRKERYLESKQLVADAVRQAIDFGAKVELEDGIEDELLEIGAISHFDIALYRTKETLIDAGQFAKDKAQEASDYTNESLHKAEAFFDESMAVTGSYLSNKIESAKKKLRVERILDTFLPDSIEEMNAESEYDGIDSNEYDDLSEYEKDSERFFEDNKLIIPSPTHFSRFTKGFSDTFKKWEKTFLETNDDTEE
ncbi:hypothetical protein H5P27_15570 [Pelagicoccus albus]|uniref:Chromosome segregation ATPase n=2 Tax=Pelagicoccus albus TaxID=415222 RepID=A0A7X1B8E9_9BACT|nr:hypothetical protein [Pelagicoccus albus]MBC2607471.1 hypothetical protein [Pelagicoccus albus]